MLYGLLKGSFKRNIDIDIDIARLFVTITITVNSTTYRAVTCFDVESFWRPYAVHRRVP